MTRLTQAIEAEKRMRDALEQNGLPQPDHVEYGFTCIRLFFHSSKTVVVVDLDEDEDEEGVEAEAARTASVPAEAA